ncbi:MAG TPA: hypothetical protein PLN21_09285 [Gemmatales bacterium]|nr:hypothetical protein [Gemmatales bacterium]
MAPAKKPPTTHARIRKTTCEMLEIIAAQRGSDIPSIIDELFLQQIKKEYQLALNQLQQKLKPEAK